MTSSDRQLDPAILPGGKCLQVGVCTRWKSDGLMIDEMLSALGHVSQPIVDFATGPKPNRPLDAVLIVGDSLDEWLERQARSARLAQRRCLKIILMGFPRRFEVVRLQRAGGSGIRVISKPFDVGQIQQQLQDFAARSSPQGRLR
jgi:hypothetical protein